MHVAVLNKTLVYMLSVTLILVIQIENLDIFYLVLSDLHTQIRVENNLLNTQVNPLD